MKLAYFITLTQAMLLFAVAVMFVACDQANNPPYHLIPADQIDQLRSIVVDYNERIISGNANLGDSVSYAMQGIGLMYTEAAYLHHVTEEEQQRAEQLVEVFSKAGGVPTQSDLKEIAAKLGTPFFKVETSETGGSVQVLDLSQIPFEHVAHLQPTMITYSISTTRGRVTTQIVLPGSFDLISEYLTSVGLPADRLLPGSGKGAGGGVQWKPGMPLPYYVPDCEKGEEPYMIAHPEYGSYFSCAMVVTGSGGAPSPPAPITCVVCDYYPDPVIPANPYNPWLPGTPTLPREPNDNGGYTIQANADVGRATPVREGSGGSKYRFTPRIGYQMNPYGYADLEWLRMKSVKSSYEANVIEVYAIGKVTYTGAISAALKSLGFNAGIELSSTRTMSPRVLINRTHEYKSFGQFDSYNLNLSTSCTYPQISTSLRLTNTIDGKWTLNGQSEEGSATGESSSPPIQCGYVR